MRSTNSVQPPPSSPTPASQDSCLYVRRALEEGSQDDAAFLFERYRARALRVAQGLVGTGLKRDMDPEDLVSSAWVRVWADRKAFEYHGSGSLFFWLVLQMHRIAAQSARKGGNSPLRGAMADRVEMPETLRDPSAVTGSVMARRGELEDRVRAAVAQLPTLYRQVIEATYLNGESRASVAERLGAKPDTLRRQITRGVQRLRELLGDEELFQLED